MFETSREESGVDEQGLEVLVGVLKLESSALLASAFIAFFLAVREVAEAGSFFNEEDEEVVFFGVDFTTILPPETTFFTVFVSFAAGSDLPFLLPADIPLTMLSKILFFACSLFVIFLVLEETPFLVASLAGLRNDAFDLIILLFNVSPFLFALLIVFFTTFFSAIGSFLTGFDFETDLDTVVDDFVKRELLPDFEDAAVVDFVISFFMDALLDFELVLFAVILKLDFFESVELPLI